SEWTRMKPIPLVGTARCAVRAAYQRRNVVLGAHATADSFRPLYGRGHRSAMSLPFPFAFIRVPSRFFPPMKLSEMRELLEREGIQLTKSLGQNFLHDANQLRRIVAAAELKPPDKGLEIRPRLL